MAYARRNGLNVLAAMVVAATLGALLVYYRSGSPGPDEAGPRTTQPLQWPAREAPASDTVCHTVKLRIEQVEKAQEEGYNVDPQRRCITRTEHAAHEQARLKWEETQAQKAEQDRKKALEQKLQAELEQTVQQQRATTLQTLAQARAGMRTHVHDALLPKARMAQTPLPRPPATLFVPMAYTSQGMALTAFVTPDPRDGARHPAVVWLTGGDTNSLDDFWTEGNPRNDQSASAFRKAGMVMVFPTLRGGNTNPGLREYFWGEVDDVVAAIAQAARLPYVDPQRIYLGGHSTGGTLALLVAATGIDLRGVFAFGPLADPADYPLPVRWNQLDDQERRMRAPIHWLHAIKAPTWIIEGAEAPGNRSSVEALCAAPSAVRVQCALVAGQNHFSVLQPTTRTLAAQLIMGQEPWLEPLSVRR